MNVSSLVRIREKARQRRYRLTAHAQIERFADKLALDSIETVLLTGDIVEDYPEDARGRSCLMLGQPQGIPVHMVVGCLEDDGEDLVVITVYRPDPQEWEADWRTRRRREA